EDEDEHAVPGERVEIVLPFTPFYVESGGQVSDTGILTSQTRAGDCPAWQITVRDTRRPVPGLIVHVCDVEYGQPRIGDPCVAQVDTARRLDIMRNHTATHILQKSLRSVVGNHVGQQGSLVAPDRLRFDYSHGAPLSSEQLERVSEMLNDAILANYPVTVRQESYQDAIREGALAFFSEKYGDIVRVLRIGAPDAQPFSVELCGGTHVHQTGDIGSAIIVSETAVAAGVRRIEVVTGHGALSYARKQAQQLATLAAALNTTPEQVIEQTSKILTSLSETQKALERAQKELARARFGEMLANVISIKDVPALIVRAAVDNVDMLRDMTDWFREKHQSGVAVLGAVVNEKPAIVVAVSKDLNGRGLDAGKLAREVAKLVGGSGGGRPTLAQAGGRDAGKLDEALAHATKLINEWLG
ncbi:MAG: DHHA1 domain-containing protein, partial [Chloroflexi bacterium]|nr:DHHA1 domain-containing protein [Chloroflexota bacterium]